MIDEETFEEVDGGAALSDDRRMARYCFRTLAKYPIIYGSKRYSDGIHSIRFLIDKRADLRSFIGIVSSMDRVSRVISTENDNRSLYGWWGLNILVQNGKISRNQEKNEVQRFDQLTLKINCDEQEIQLEHHRTNRSLKLSIDPSVCPLPWKIVVELPSYGDSIRLY